MSKIDSHTETKIVALMARGDSHSQIQEAMQREGKTIAISTLTDIKKRNSEALSYIQGKMIEHETSKTARILDKTRAMIDKKLDAAENLDETIAALRDKLESGEIDEHEHNLLFNKALKDADISVKDLTTVSKEMFTQSQIEAGKPTSITENPDQAKKNLTKLLAAINSGKEEDIVKAIFLDA